MSKDLKVIGHRGAMGYEPENTLASFRKAVSLGVHGVELDVHLVDGHLMVIHDDRLDRTTDGNGLLTGRSFSELRKLDAGNGETIPTLDEVFNEMAGKTALNIELKGHYTVEPAAKFIADKRKEGWPNETFLVSSFSREMMFHIRELDRKILLGILADGPITDHFDIAEQLNAYSIHLALNQTDRDLVQEAHQRGLKIFIYTVNEAEALGRMIALGVDGVFTDYPDRALKCSTKTNPPSGWL